MAGTLRGAAIQHGIPYDGAEIHLSLKTNVMTDGPLDPRERQLRIAKIEASVTVRGKIDALQQDVLKRAIETCPVGNTLRQGLRLHETVKFVSWENP